MVSTRRTMWMLAAGLLALLAVAACDEGGGGSPLDDGLPDTDTDTNDAPANLCASYPEADNAFGVGEVVRNYTFFDRQDEEHQLCEVAGGSKTLLLLVLSSST